MIVCSSPLWLATLALIPLIWWLHRFRRRGLEFMVSSLILWRSQTSRHRAGRHKSRADRIWLLRAFIVSLLVLALSGPGWKQTIKADIHLWLDDSISMGAMEKEGKSRMELGLSGLLAALDEAHAGHLKVHSLAAPSRPILDLKDSGRGRWQTMLSEWVRLVDRAPMPPKFIDPPSGEEYWLLTDGADEGLNRWIAKAPLHRVLRIGAATENSAISLLALRPAMDSSDAWRGLVQVDNLGYRPARRTLTISAGDKTLGQWRIDLPQGSSRQIEFALPEDSAVEVKARISAEDALGLDDALAVDVPGKTAVQIIGDCEPHVVAALKAHPRITQDGVPQLGIVCGDAPAPDNMAILRLHGGKTALRLKAPAVWLESAGKLRDLNLALPGLDAFEPDGRDAVPLLVSDSMPLLTLAESKQRRLDCYLDLADQAFTRQAEFPLLIAGLVDTVLAVDLLDGVASRTRASNDSKIAPRHSPAVGQQPPLSTDAVYDLTLALVALILPALLLDTWLSSRKSVAG